MEKNKSTAEPSPLLDQYRPLFSVNSDTQVLDLACGNGRNGLWFAEQGAQITFIDKDTNRLTNIPPHSQVLDYDLEDDSAPQLPSAKFDFILVFNYLHRPLLPQINRALATGGILIYETFLAAQSAVGRPKNPRFLLQPNELTAEFNNLQFLYYFEGNTNDQEQPCYKAQLIAKKMTTTR